MRVFVPGPSAPAKCRKVPGKSIAAVPTVSSLRDSSSIRFSCKADHNILSASRPTAEIQTGMASDKFHSLLSEISVTCRCVLCAEAHASPVTNPSLRGLAELSKIFTQGTRIAPGARISIIRSIETEWLSRSLRHQAYCVLDE